MDGPAQSSGAEMGGVVRAIFGVRKNTVLGLNRQPGFPTKSLRDCIPNQGARAMLAEIFMLRMEAIVRANAPAPGGGSDARFVPIKPPASPAKDQQQAPK
jgi:hypothetical protein